MSSLAPEAAQVIPQLPGEVLHRLSPDSRECIERLLEHQAPPPTDYGIVKQAAVLVALYEQPGEGKLRVLLTTRAKTLRRHPGLTALPGGKVDPEDPSPIHTARREAFEEVDLPLDHPSIHQLTTLEPVMTILPLNAHMRNHIIVTPVVCLISDPTLVDHLRPNPDEVDHVFSHPLEAVLRGQPDASSVDTLAKSGGEWWPHEEEFYSMADRVGVTGWHRMHRFRTTHSPIKGLTSDVLIEVATIAHGVTPPYGALAPSQQPFGELISRVVTELPGVLQRDAEAAQNGIVVEEKRPEWGSGVDGVTIPSAEKWSVK